MATKGPTNKLQMSPRPRDRKVIGVTCSDWDDAAVAAEVGAGAANCADVPAAFPPAEPAPYGLPAPCAGVPHDDADDDDGEPPEYDVAAPEGFIVPQPDDAPAGCGVGAGAGEGLGLGLPQAEPFEAEDEGPGAGAGLPHGDAFDAEDEGDGAGAGLPHAEPLEDADEGAGAGEPHADEDLPCALWLCCDFDDVLEVFALFGFGVPHPPAFDVYGLDWLLRGMAYAPYLLNSPLRHRAQRSFCLRPTDALASDQCRPNGRNFFILSITLGLAAS